MDSFRVEWKSAALRELRKLPKEARARIVSAVERLSADPFPPGVRKLVGSEHSYRIRQGDYRVIYSVETQILLIEIIKVGHRRDVYDR